jgi:hypothetical protein
MKLSLINILFGLFLVTVSLFAARLIKKRWGQICVILLGTVMAGIVAFFPALIFILNSPKAPSDSEILYLLYGSDIKIQESLDRKTLYIVQELSEIEKEQFNYAVQVNTNITYKERGWDHDPKKILVLTRTGPPDCCDRSHLPVLGVAVFSW